MSVFVHIYIFPRVSLSISANSYGKSLGYLALILILTTFFDAEGMEGLNHFWAERFWNTLCITTTPDYRPWKNRDKRPTNPCLTTTPPKWPIHSLSCSFISPLVIIIYPCVQIQSKSSDFPCVQTQFIIPCTPWRMRTVSWTFLYFQWLITQKNWPSVFVSMQTCE